MQIDGSFIVLAVGAYIAYRLACRIDPTIRKTTDREDGSPEHG